MALDNYETLVAEIDGVCVGFVGMCKQLAYEFDGPYVRVLAFVVHEQYRRKQIGNHLMQAVEDWARAHDCIAITLNSGNRQERQAAHLFYERLGYVQKSTGFSKRVTDTE